MKRVMVVSINYLLDGEFVVVVRGDVDDFDIQQAAVECHGLSVEEISLGAVLADEAPREKAHCQCGLAHIYVPKDCDPHPWH